VSHIQIVSPLINVLVQSQM